jgi:hypothetical protein
MTPDGDVRGISRKFRVSNNSWGRLWEPYVDTAIGAWEQGDKARTDKIVSLLIQVLKQGQQYNAVDENLVNGLYSVADHLCADGEYSLAEWIYLNVLESQEDILGPDDPKALQTLLKLSSLVMACGATPQTSTADDLPSTC